MPLNKTSSDLRNRIGAGLLGITFAFLVGAIIIALRTDERPEADPENPSQVALGKSVYASQCASCHGARLEGQPDWREKLPSGRMPAPPHAQSAHRSEEHTSELPTQTN